MKDKIFNICESLTEQGIKPTLENVRNQLGGGSFSTINPLLKAWKDSKTSAPAEKIAIPPEAAKAVEQTTALLWTLATEHHNEALNAIRTEATRIEQAAIAERDEALGEIERLEKQIKELDAANTEKSQKIRVMNEETCKDVAEKNKLKKEAEIQKIKLDSAMTATEKAEELKQELKQQAEIINALKLEIATQKLSIENSAAAMEKQKAENAELKEQATKAANHDKAQTKEINSLSLQNQKLQTALDSNNKALESAKGLSQELKQSQNEAAKLAGMLEVYTAKTNK